MPTQDYAPETFAQCGLSTLFMMLDVLKNLAIRMLYCEIRCKHSVNRVVVTGGQQGSR